MCCVPCDCTPVLKCSLVLLIRLAASARLQSDSIDALLLLTVAAEPVATRLLSSAPPIAMSPPLKISACSRLFRVCAPRSSRLRAAMVAAVPFSTSLLTVPAWIATWSP
ncbi:hypothetical protein GO304_03461 [Ralstonia solanacearum]|nr:hypothetical protein [Ralstonia solanacearum]NJZ79217.1 hypothetical protein [Ralstonia solanacearum]